VSATDETRGMPAAANPLLDDWCRSVALVLESMTDQRPEVGWQPVNGALPEAAAAIASDAAAMLWWEQPFQVSPDAIVWVGAPKPVWEYAGTLTLKAAGLETIEAEEARNTWLEILGQSLSGMARSIGGRLGREVTCDAGVERQPEAEIRQWASVSLDFAGTAPGAILVAFSPKLVAALSAPPPAAPGHHEAAPAQPSGTPGTQAAGHGRNMDLLLDVELPVSISFGRAQLPLKEVLKLTTGSIVELNRGVNDQVEVLVNQCLVARGEVVVVEGNYAVRIQEIASRQERLRSIP
jgi:flagellar motor switch protein FliN